MFDIIGSLFDLKKEIVIGVSLSALYVTYYLFEVVKKPILICAKGEFRSLLEQHVAMTRECFWPTPWCVEARLQTVAGSVVRGCVLQQTRPRRQLLRLADGGLVALDWLVEGERDVLLVLPGLSGGAHADYALCLAAAARALHMDCAVLVYRGLCGLPLTSPRLYCAVSHADLAEALACLRVARPGASLLAVGVSLGGLILGHYLADAGDQADVAAALIISSPLDVVKGAECMDQPILNALLSYHMTRNLKNTLAAHPPLHEEWQSVRGARSVRQFDAGFTVKHFGFPDVEAYYRAASLHDKLGQVRVPLLCLQAADDPFQPWCALPVGAVAGASSVAMLVPARGGHIGFLEGVWPPSDPGRHYIARLACQYFSALRGRPHLMHTQNST